jgi:hypothetical protein
VVRIEGGTYILTCSCKMNEIQGVQSKVKYLEGLFIETSSGTLAANSCDLLVVVLHEDTAGQMRRVGQPSGDSIQLTHNNQSSQIQKLKATIEMINASHKICHIP